MIKIENTKKQKLSQFIKTQFPLISRSQVNTLIKNEWVKTGIKDKKEKNKKTDAELIDGELVSIDMSCIRKYVVELKDLSRVNTDLNIMYEDAQIIVINKPAGLLVHGTKDSLVNKVQKYVIEKSTDPFAEVTPVHRLDKDTSGVILFAKNIDALKFYSKQFKQRHVQKKYIALVSGSFNILNCEIKTHISKRPKNRKYYSTDSSNGDLAITEVSILKQFEFETLVLITPLTGRTHQIRVHLSEQGYPILGDVIYNGKDWNRLMLHALELEVKVTEDQEPLVFKTEIPEEFMQGS